MGLAGRCVQLRLWCCLGWLGESWERLTVQGRLFVSGGSLSSWGGANNDLGEGWLIRDEGFGGWKGFWGVAPVSGERFTAGYGGPCSIAHFRSFALF